MIKPPALKKGDTIAVIQPASKIETKAYDKSIKLVRELGFCVAEYPLKKKADKFFSASDQDRAKELHWALSEPGIRAVLSCRGGYGSQRALSLISKKDFKAWKPKILVGYSDLTYLHQWIQNHLGWISFHGPLIGMLEKSQFKKLLNDLLSLNSQAETSQWSEIKNIGTKKMGKGTLVGGNLSLLQVAGPSKLPHEPLILALEDVNENFYRIDRMLRSLIDAGYSKWVQGIILGTFTFCGEKDRKTFTFEKVIESFRLLTNGPIWMNAQFGHGLQKAGQRILPLGAQVSIEGKAFRVHEGVISDR